MRRLCTLILISALLAGCAARGPATAVRRLDPPELWQRYAEKLPLGAAVRVATAGGDHFNGTLLIVDDTGVTVKPTTRLSEPVRKVRFDELTRLELRDSTSSPGERAGALGLGIGTGVGVFLGALFLLFALFGD